MRGYPLKAKQENFPKHIKKSYANGLWRRSCGCIVIYTVAHPGRTLCLPAFLIGGAHLDLTPSRVSTGTRGGPLTLQPTRGQTVGVCVCLFVPTTKSHARPRLWKCSHVPEPRTEPTIRSGPNCPPTTSLCVFALQTPTSHQNLPAL